MTITVNTDAGLVWIDGRATPTTQSVARLISLLYGRQDNLVTYDEIERSLNISYHTRAAYLRDARRLLNGSDVRLRTVKGHGIVLEQIPAGVAA